MDDQTVLQTLVQQQQSEHQDQSQTDRLEQQNHGQNNQNHVVLISKLHQHKHPAQEGVQRDQQSDEGEKSTINLAKTDSFQTISNDKENEHLLHQTTRALFEQHDQLITATGAVTVHALQSSASSEVQGTHTHITNSLDSIPITTSAISTSTAVTGDAVSPVVSPIITRLTTFDPAMAPVVATTSNTASATDSSDVVSSLATSSSSAAALAPISVSKGPSNVLVNNRNDVISPTNDPPIINSLGLDINNRFEKCPTIIKWPANEWETWLEQEKTHCRWNLIRHRYRDKQVFARGPTASEWTREYHCDHAGQYRDRKNPNIDPSKKRKRTGSIKCNCPAFIKMRKSFSDDDVVIEYYWKHEGHIPDLMEDIKAQRLPQDLKAWIKRRVNEGHDWKSVKGMMTQNSPLLDELHPTTKANVRLLLQASYAQHANTLRQMKSKQHSGSSSKRSSGASSPIGEASNGNNTNIITSTPRKIAIAPRPISSSITSGQGSAQTTWQFDSNGSSVQQHEQLNGTATDNQTLAVHRLVPNQVSKDKEMTVSETTQHQQDNSPRSVQALYPNQQPRDMMLQMLRAIADLQKEMEANEEYVSQEDANHIIESFALPIRLMKEALERRVGSR